MQIIFKYILASTTEPELVYALPLLFAARVFNNSILLFNNIIGWEQKQQKTGQAFIFHSLIISYQQKLFETTRNIFHQQYSQLNINSGISLSQTINKVWSTGNATIRTRAWQLSPSLANNVA